MYAPGVAAIGGPLVSPYSALSIGVELAAAFPAAPVSATWSAANRAVYIPVYLARPETVTKLWWVNGAAVSGNVDCGIYTFAGGTTAARVVSTGSTAQAGTSALQSVDIADTTLSPGLHLMALACDNTTAAFLRMALNAAVGRLVGVYLEAAAFVLPATATVAAATGYVPMFGLALAPRTLV